MQAKLVRDKIPDIIIKNGQIPHTHIAEDDEYAQALLDKLHEEVDEFTQDQNIEELADILEVVNTLAQQFDENVESLRKKKREERGGFEKKIILESVDS